MGGEARLIFSARLRAGFNRKILFPELHLEVLLTDEIMPEGPPRLAYISDLAVGDFGNGPKVVWCLLEAYPPEKRCLLVSDWWDWSVWTTASSLASESFPMKWHRFTYGRLYGWMSTQCLLSASSKARRLVTRLEAFQPQGILTVAAGPTWLTAAHVARLLNVPLHLIVHDDLATQCAVESMFRPWMQRRFREVYRQAKSRLCVSPNMEEFYRREFGVPGVVLYPGRSVCDSKAKVADLTCRTGRPFTVLYAGSLAPKPYVELLGRIAVTLEPIDGRLVIYSLTSADEEHLQPLRRSNVELRVGAPLDEVKRRMPKEADVLFVPMSFDAADAVNVRIGFPSKIADYTATGLPLLVWGPEYCSAVRWAKEFPNAAAVVDSPKDLALVDMLKRLKDEPTYRYQLAEGAVKAGEECFSYATARRVFYGALCQ